MELDLDVGEERMKEPKEDEGIRGVRNGLEVYLASAAASGIGDTGCW